jgi:hypothetical protein
MAFLDTRRLQLDIFEQQVVLFEQTTVPACRHHYRPSLGS